MADPSKVAWAGSAGVSEGPATLGARNDRSVTEGVEEMLSVFAEFLRLNPREVLILWSNSV